MNLHLHRLFEHMAWADQRVLDGLRMSAGSDPAALEYFAHVLAAEHVWASRVQQRPSEYAVWPSLSLEECAALAQRNRAEYQALLAAMQDGDGDREIAYRNSAGDAFVSRLEDILLHVALHGSYHRGQVSLVVRRSGGTPVPTDFIAFVRGAPAATRTHGSGTGAR
ncbi:MAG TPA: DinB family protein [Gemmatimonadaceae bacterium]|nr:DinB family protein [Gemmatimonadaceae bacterium]